MSRRAICRSWLALRGLGRLAHREPVAVAAVAGSTARTACWAISASTSSISPPSRAGIDIAAMNCRLKTFDKAQGDRIGEYVLDANDSFAMSVEFCNGAIGVIHATPLGHRPLQRPAPAHLWRQGRARSLSTGTGARCCGSASARTSRPAPGARSTADPVPTNYQRFAEAVRTGKQGEPGFRHAADLQKVLDLALVADLDRAEHRVLNDTRLARHSGSAHKGRLICVCSFSEPAAWPTSTPSTLPPSTASTRGGRRRRRSQPAREIQRHAQHPQRLRLARRGDCLGRVRCGGQRDARLASTTRPRSPRSRPASTCSARSRWRPTTPRRSRWSRRPRAPGLVNMVNLTYRNVAAAAEGARDRDLRADRRGQARRGELPAELAGFARPGATGAPRASGCGGSRKKHGSNGVLGDIGVHILDFASYGSGLEIDHVFCAAQDLRQGAGQQDRRVRTRRQRQLHHGGRLRQRRAGRRSMPRRWATGHFNELRLRVYGEKGGVEVQHRHDGSPAARLPGRGCRDRDVEGNGSRAGADQLPALRRGGADRQERRSRASATPPTCRRCSTSPRSPIASAASWRRTEGRPLQPMARSPI